MHIQISPVTPRGIKRRKGREGRGRNGELFSNRRTKVQQKNHHHIFGVEGLKAQTIQLGHSVYLQI